MNHWPSQLQSKQKDVAFFKKTASSYRLMEYFSEAFKKKIKLNRHGNADVEYRLNIMCVSLELE